MRPLSVAIVANGFADGPAQALRDYLVGRGSTVVTIFHPLTREQGTRHVVTTYAEGSTVAVSSRFVPLRPPLSFAADPIVPLRLPRVDAWIGFNPLACARGLVQRRVGRAPKVVLWSVDFVPDRFGPATLLTRLYNRIDRLCCTSADSRVELSEAARIGRDAHHRLDPRGGLTLVVPMGAWLERVPRVPEDGFARRRVVYLGHLVRRQGVETLLEALALVHAQGGDVFADIIGSGPEESRLRDSAHSLGVSDVVRFHGYVPDHRDVERLLASSSIAVAPYEPSASTFTRYADPGKLKAYLAAGLPIIVTDVPPSARELASDAGATLVPYDAAAVADAIVGGLASPEQWRERRSQALRYVRRFDWSILLPDALARLGLR
jgi:glycosyltransferase involved in cell wall biosynthesis